jgi:hypothetical protein
MSRRTTDPVRPNPQLNWPAVIAYGACAGLLGVAACVIPFRSPVFGFISFSSNLSVYFVSIFLLLFSLLFSRYRCSIVASVVLNPTTPMFSMTATERIEQFFTARPSSQVPGRTLSRLLAWAAGSISKISAPTADEADPETLTRLTWTMHFGQGAVVAVVRAVAAYSWGIRGPFADFLFAGVRLAVDQTLENLTGVGALPW